MMANLSMSIIELNGTCIFKYEPNHRMFIIFMLSQVPENFNPLASAKRPKYRTFDQNFNFNLRRDPQTKISYEHRAYESVYEKSLSQAMSRKTTKKESRAQMGKTSFHLQCTIF